MKIITAFWGNKYDEELVRKLPIDICFSDKTIRGIKTLPIDMSYKSTWKKMTLFDKRLDLGDCLFLDLDIILQGDINILVDYYYKNRVKNKVLLAHVHWFDSDRILRDKNSYIPCNVNSGVYAFNNAECDYIYQEVVKHKPKLEMLFEGTDKWFYHKHKDWYTFWPDEMIQHNKFDFMDYDKSKAIILSENRNASGRNKI